MNNWLLLIIFLFIGILNLIFIVHENKRYTRLSNGYYKNSGQKLVFLCNITKEEALYKLSKKAKDDTLYYDFFVRDGKYYIHVKGIKKYNRQDILTVVFEIDFTYVRNSMYIVVSLDKKWQWIYAGTYEIELYEFMANKIGAIPVESVQ